MCIERVATKVFNRWTYCLQLMRGKEQRNKPRYRDISVKMNLIEGGVFHSLMLLCTAGILSEGFKVHLILPEQISAGINISAAKNLSM